MTITAHIQTYHGITDGWQTITTRRTKQEAERFLRYLSLVRPHYIHKITRSYS
jgi:hypothetical protein